MFREHPASMQPPASREAEQLIVRLLKRTMPFQVISEDMLQSVAAVSRPFSYRAGEVIYRAGDKADDVYVVVSGAVEHLLSDTPTTVERNRVMHSGDVYGWAAVLGQDSRVRLATATCVETAEVIRINGAALIERLNEDPATAAVVMSRFATMITREFGAPAAAAKIAAPDRSAPAAAPRPQGQATGLALTMFRISRWLRSPQPYLMLIGFALFLGFWYLSVEVWKLPRFREMPGITAVFKEWFSHEPDLRAIVLYAGVLPAHLGERLARRAGVLPRDRARRAVRPLPRLVEEVQGVRLSGVRDAAPDPDPRLGAARDRDVLATGVGGDLPRPFSRRSSPPPSTRCSASNRSTSPTRARRTASARASCRCSGTSSCRARCRSSSPACRSRSASSWFSLVAAEMVSGQYGLGYVINTSYTMVRYPTIVIGMITLGAVGYVTSALVRVVGDYMMQWRVRELALGGR